MDSHLAMGANDSSKYIPYSWLYPYTTSLTLFLTMILNLSSLFLNTHLESIIGWLIGLGTSIQTLLLSNWLCSSYIVKSQCSSNSVSWKFLSSICDKNARFSQIFLIEFLVVTPFNGL